MQNLKSRWMQISEDDREEVLANRFGWMLKNLLEYGNTLVPNQAVRKNDISHICKSLEYDLYTLGFDANVRVTRHEELETNDVNYIAEAEFLNEGERNGKRSMQKNKRGRKVL